MNLYFRLLLRFFASRFGPRAQVLDTVTTSVRVLPADLDVALHVNNARYLSFMDLGRFVLTLRSPLGRVVLQRRWVPIIGGVLVRYRREAKLLQRLDVATRVLGWDERWFLIESRITRNGQEVMSGIVRLNFRARGRLVPVAEVLAAVGVDPAARRWDDVSAAWSELEGAAQLNTEQQGQTEQRDVAPLKAVS